MAESKTPTESSSSPLRRSALRQVNLRLILQPGEHYHLNVTTLTPEGEPLETHTLALSNPPQNAESLPLPSWVTEAVPSAGARFWQRLWSRVQALPWVGALTVLAIAFYAFTRLVGLDRFPIYFFSDEAVQTLLAADFLRDGLRNYDGEFLPTYFENGGQYNLSLSVYLQVLPYLLFGRSVIVTRATSALITCLAALWVALIMRRAFGSRFPWLATLILTVTPAWFLHSRTAFETALATSFYAGFLYYYSRYRLEQPRYLLSAALMAALTFYSYSPAQVVVAVSVVLLAVLDARYHLQHRREAGQALGLGVLLLLPYVRFQLTYPGETLRHLEILRSYWLQPLPLEEKLHLWGQEYLQGLNLLYWFRPDPPDLIRHVMKNYGHLWRPGLLFTLIGIILVMRHLRQPAYRTLLVAVLAAPSGAAMVEMGVTRALFMVIPAALLTALGLEWVIRRIGQSLAKWLIPSITLNVLAGITFAGLSLYGLEMLHDSLHNAPLWYRNYGLNGMQYGAQQIFAAVQDYLQDHPGTKILVSPTWANGTDALARFFAGDPLPFELGNIDGFVNEYRPELETLVLVMTPEEYERARNSPKFTGLQIEQILPYPDGRPGFYFVRLRYVDNIEAILEAERQQRRLLVEGKITLLDGSQAQVAYSYLDMGEIQHAFDGDPTTMIRTYEANPLRIQLTFSDPKLIHTFTFRVGGVPTRVTVQLWAPDTAEAMVVSQEVGETPLPREVTLSLPAPQEVLRMEIEVLNVRDGEPAHVHLWEVQWR
ncbi:MAG: ArnT family glycosyltransferase [Thermanaerothrix sp.]|uniref:Glycosyltransferase family 39 protein n=1 Tax=Thermanaerothrix solaris TaxID=3058434 RepID=A0ABU3NQG2_9CHLR|nr:glycosyltransferase family 39 protein [Thermanaerothrix sp. 4228-RoL]MDT8899037.1 glycosyltransferase family 39 protein [Thermanaerothrix sp. 4228-RoL]